MIRTDELRGIIVKNGFSQLSMAKKIGITPKTFYEKMKKGVFGSDEIQIMIDELNIENPMEIFFAKEVTLKDTNNQNVLDSACAVDGTSSEKVVKGENS